MLKTSFFGIFFVLILFLICPVDATTNNLTVNPLSYSITNYSIKADTVVYPSGSTNYGTAQVFDLYGNINAALFRFDISNNLSVSSIKFYYYVPSGSGYFSVYMANNAWDEYTVIREPSTIGTIGYLPYSQGWNYINIPSDYLTPGNYTIKFLGTSGSIVSRENTSFAPYVSVNASGTIPLVANFTGSPTSGNPPLSVQFTDSTPGYVTNWLWDFGDGVTSTLQNPTHIFARSGNHTVKLNATRLDGVGTLTRTNYIYVNPDIISNNYTNNDSRAFLVTAGQAINFNITPSFSSYSWDVNTTAQSSTSNNFTFVVPTGYDHESKIWGIRVNATYANGTSVYRKWLISSLPANQAPDVIESFASLDAVNGSKWFKDPWGRYEPAWTKSGTIDPTLASKGIMTSGSALDSGDIIATNNTGNCTGGTLVFRLKIPTRTEGNGAFAGLNNLTGVDLNPYDGHDYVSCSELGSGYAPISKHSLGSAPSQHPWIDYRNYSTIKLIWTDDGWIYVFRNNELYPGIIGHRTTKFTLDGITLRVFSTSTIDNVQFYKNKYLFPSNSIYYGNYSKWWYLNSAQAYHSTPAYDNGIIVQGQNVSLKNMADAINDESKISYNTGTKTATIKTNIFLKAGSELNITGETGIFDTSSGSLFVRPDAGSTVKIENSKITTSSSNPLIWGFVSITAPTVLDPKGTELSWNQLSDTVIYYNWRGRLIIENSTIDNSNNMFIHSAHETTLNNVIFSNMSNGDFGQSGSNCNGINPYNSIGMSWGDGIQKAMWMTPGMDMFRFSVNNVSFVNPKETLKFGESGGQFVMNETVIENSDLSKIGIKDQKSMKACYDLSYYLRDEFSHLSLINCKYNESNFTVATDKSTIETKYYADVLVKDSYGNVIPDATVTITASNNNYSSENLYKYESYKETLPADGNTVGNTAYGYYATHPYEGGYNEWGGFGAGGASGFGAGSIDATGTLTGNLKNVSIQSGWWHKIINAQPCTTFTTGSNGRTSLPTENVNNTIVFTDKVFTNETGIQTSKSITYTIKVNAFGYQNATISNVDPNSTWYTSKLSQPQQIIVTLNQSSGSAPVANLEANQTSGTNSLTVQFTDQSTFSPTSCAWNFGDGSANSSQKNPTHTFSSPGNYTVTLTATNNYGSNTMIRTGYITVNSGGGNSINETTGDINMDGTVNTQDVDLITQHYAETYNDNNKPYPPWDVNQDGVVNIKDIIIVQEHFIK